MKTLLRKLGVCAVALAAVVGLGMMPGGAHAQDGKLRFVMVSHAPNSDSWWNTVRNAFKAAGKAMDVDVEYRNPPNGDLANMARIIEQATASRPDGLIVTIADYDVLKRPINKAVELGIPVITINSGTEKQSAELGAKMHVGQPEHYAGLKAGERAKKAGVTKFLCVNHYITNPASVERCQGFAEGLGVKLGDQMIDSGVDPTKIQNKVQAYLRQHPDTNGILTLGPLSAHPTIRAVKELGLDGQVFFATFDLSDQIADAIDNGIINFAIDQQPYLQGYMPVVVLALYDRYGLMPANNIRSGPGFITKDNLALVKKLAGTVR